MLAGVLRLHRHLVDVEEDLNLLQLLVNETILAKNGQLRHPLRDHPKEIADLHPPRLDPHGIEIGIGIDLEEVGINPEGGEIRPQPISNVEKSGKRIKAGRAD